MKPTPRSPHAGDKQSSLAALVEDLIAANRILVQHAVLDAYGHVSARHPENPEHFLISRSVAPELVTEADIMELALDGKPARHDLRKPHLETPIHSEIYKAR